MSKNWSCGSKIMKGPVGLAPSSACSLSLKSSHASSNQEQFSFRKSLPSQGFDIFTPSWPNIFTILKPQNPLTDKFYAFQKGIVRLQKWEKFGRIKPICVTSWPLILQKLQIFSLCGQSFRSCFSESQPGHLFLLGWLLPLFWFCVEAGWFLLRLSCWYLYGDTSS